MQASKNNKIVYAGMFIAIVTLIAYWRILQNGFISYDDTTYLFDNDHVRNGLTIDGILWSLTSAYEANWFPLTWISHMIDVSVFGYNPLGHHLVSLVIHIVNAVLLLCILVRTTGSVWRSAAVAALFALHPLHVESVAWVAERKDVLSTFFFLTTLMAYSYYVASRTVPGYICVVVLYLCGLASKPMLVSLPLVLFLLDVWPLRRIRLAGEFAESIRGSNWLLLREKLPLAALSAASCVLTLNVQKGQSAVLDVAHHSLADNAAHAIVNYVLYLGKMFWPFDLAVIYPYDNGLQLWKVAGAAVLLSLLTALALWQRKTKTYWAVGWFWFLITLLPVVGFVKIGEHSIADRYAYIPLIGLFIALVWGVSDYLGEKPRGPVAAAVISLLLFPLLAGATWKQTGYWKDSITLFEHTLQTTSNNYVADINLGSELLKYGRTDQAIGYLREAVRLNPENPGAYYYLGVALDTLGDFPGAIEALRTVLIMDPVFKGAQFYLATSYAHNGDMKAAFEQYEALMPISPGLAYTLKNYLDTFDKGRPGTSSKQP